MNNDEAAHLAWQLAQLLTDPFVARYMRDYEPAVSRELCEALRPRRED